MIDVLTYKGDGVAEKRHNENGKIDYFVARATFNGDFMGFNCYFMGFNDIFYGINGDLMGLKSDFMGFYGDLMGINIINEVLW